MKKIIRTVYVSIDKKEFNNKEDCITYEVNIMQDKLKESHNIIEAESAKDMPPYYCPQDDLQSYSYRWFIIKNEKGAKEIMAAFPDLCNPSHADFNDNIKEWLNKWICIKYEKDNIKNGPVALYALNISTARYVTLLNRLITTAVDNGIDKNSEANSTADVIRNLDNYNIK